MKIELAWLYQTFWPTDRFLNIMGVGSLNSKRGVGRVIQ